MHNPVLIDWIKRTSSNAELVLSVCTGALLLAKAGLLEGLEATTHHAAIELLRRQRRRRRSAKTIVLWTMGALSAQQA